MASRMPGDREAILQVLADEYCRSIIFSTFESAKTVEQIASENGIPNSTCYRKIKELVALRLMKIERIVITSSGKRFATYRSRVESVSMVISSSGVSLEIMDRLPEPERGLEAHAADRERARAILGSLLDDSLRVLEADMGIIQLVGEDGSLRIVAHRGFEQPFLDFFRVVDRRTAAACAAAESSRKRVIVEDVSRSPIFAGTPSLTALSEAGVRAVQSTPIVTRAGNLIGVVSTHYSKPHVPRQPDLQAFDLLIRRIVDGVSPYVHELQEALPQSSPS